jgi:glyoxylase I family protein
VSSVAFSHVALNCRDLAATEAFYARLGFRPVRRIPLGESAIVFLRLGSALLELFAADGAVAAAEGDGPHAAGAVRHIAFQTDDVDAILAEMGSDAVVTLGPLDFDAFIPGWRTVWLRDPDGVIVEISQGYVDEAGG